MLLLVPLLTVILIRYRGQFAFMRWNRANKILAVMILALGVRGRVIARIRMLPSNELAAVDLRFLRRQLLTSAGRW